jgi:hypothetical protein
MKYFHSYIRLMTLLTGLLSASDILSQQPVDTLLNRQNYIPVPELINQFEERHSLRIYFQPEWFSEKKLEISNLDRDLNDFLYIITQTCKCSLVSVDSSTYVLVIPDAQTAFNAQTNVNSVLLVGKMQEFGKYRKATMSGKIIDGKTGETLPGASLYIDKLKRGTTSDKSGSYTIEMPVGEYDVTLTFIGFETSAQRIKLVSDGTANFELFEKSVYIPEVVVTIDRAEFNVSRTQMSLVRLDARSIKEMPVTLGEKDIIKSITMLPGIQSSGEFGTGFYVRGGSADQNLILIEEVPLFNSSHLFGLTSVVNPEGISNVTMLKAGIPARYGERSSSVMDIKLGAFSEDKVRIRGGVGLINSRISANLSSGRKMNLYLGGRTSYSNWLLHKMPDVDLMNSLAGFYDLNGLFTFTLNPRNKISLFGYLSKDNFGIKNSMDYAYGNVLGSVKWNQILGKTLSSVLVAGFSRYNYFCSEVDTLRKENGYKINSSLLYRNLKYNFTWIPSRIHSFDAGINAFTYTVSPGKLNPYDEVSLISPLKLQTEHALEYGVYASDNITFSPALSAEIGLRMSGYAFLGPYSAYRYDPGRPRSEESITDTLIYTKNKIIKSFANPEPRISLRYSFNENNSFKLSYNRINQYINLISNTMVMNPADIWKLSNTYIKPLVCDQIAAGWFRNFEKNTFETSIELYYKRLNHIIEYKNGASLMLNPTLEADLLDASGYNLGAELYVKKNSGRITGWLSYSLSTSRRHTNSPNFVEQVNGNRYFPSSYDKPSNLNMVGNYHISRRWRFSWTFTHSTGRPVTLPELKYTVGSYPLIYYSERNKYRLPDYHRLDVAITLDESLRIKKFWKGSWTLSVVNLYARKNIYSVFFRKDPPAQSVNYQSYSLYSLYILGKPFPTLTYNFTF